MLLMCSISVSFIKEGNMKGLNSYGLISLSSVVSGSLTKDALASSQRSQDSEVVPELWITCDNKKG